MNHDEHDPFEGDLGKLARGFKYPPTPELARAVRARIEPARAPARPGWKTAGAALALALLLALFAVPSVRAALLDFLQVGAVRIFRMTTPTPTLPPQAGIPSALLSLAGQATLEQARARAGFPILLPGYPADLGAPDLVYLQDKAQMVILVWLEPADPQRVRLSLHEIISDSFIIKKMSPQIVQETSVGGQYALWTTGPYMVEVKDDDYTMLRAVDGHTLVWAVGSLTYRLETGLALEEAVRIAESLR